MAARKRSNRKKAKKKRSKKPSRKPSRKKSAKKKASKKTSGTKKKRTAPARKKAARKTPPDSGDPFPTPLSDKEDEKVEVIGSILWCEFGVGVLLRNQNNPTKQKDFGQDVIKKGREYSRGWVYKNRDGFPLDETRRCARECGMKAWDKAEDEKKGTISVDHFSKAWKELAEKYARVSRVAQKIARSGSLRAGACS